MKKIMTILAVALFAASFGVAYAGGGTFNGVTDFSGRSYDTFEIAPAAVAPGSVYESSAPGSKRMVEGWNSTGKAYDTFVINPSGSQAGSLHRNYGSKESGVRAYDTFEIGQ